MLILIYSALYVKCILLDKDLAGRDSIYAINNLISSSDFFF